MGVLKFLICSICLFLFYGNIRRVSSQDCNSSSDSTQCSAGEICTNDSCDAATFCDSSSGCSGQFTCVADYCQPSTCTTTGQCVHGQICSNDVNRKCVYMEHVIVDENGEVKLTFPEPATDGTYSEIRWFKGNTSGEGRIALYDEILTPDGPMYYSVLCGVDSNKSCNTSDKGNLDINTGELTIYDMRLKDEDNYYYSFTANIADTGDKYERQIEVYVPPSGGKIEGLSKGVVEVGTYTLTCSFTRVKPQPAEIYWTFNGERNNGSVTIDNNDDGTKSIQTVIEYKLTKDDHGEDITCTVVPPTGYGDPVTLKETLDLGWSPDGTPEVDPLNQEKHDGEDVTFICEIKLENEGNPPCDQYTWNKNGENNGGSETNTLEFKMTEAHEGNYTCTCSNVYGGSADSSPAELVFLTGPAPPPVSSSSSSTAAIIGGVVGGVVFIALIVVVVIFFIRRRNRPSNKVPKSSAEPVYAEMQQTSHSDDENGRIPHTNGNVEAGPIYAQPEKTRKLRPQRGIDNGPQYANTQGLGENPYENTATNNNPPPLAPKPNNVGPDGIVYSEISVVGDLGGGKGKKPKPRERESVKKPKVHQADEPTVYAQINPIVKSDPPQ